jgi:hypothetical protein
LISREQGIIGGEEAVPRGAGTALPVRQLLRGFCLSLVRDPDIVTRGISNRRLLSTTKWSEHIAVPTAPSKRRILMNAWAKLCEAINDQSGFTLPERNKKLV